MISTREICALLLSGAMGAGSVMTVQHVAKPKRAIHKPAAKRVAPKRQTPISAAPAQARILDCPTPSLGGDLGSIAGLTPAPNWQPSHFSGSAVTGFPPMPDADGGGWIVIPPSIQPPTVPGAVPEPVSWAMMIAGFGVVGMAARRKAVAS